MKIEQILDKIDENQLFVPAFQREFVWKRDNVKNLIDSLIKDYPIGTMLTWETNNPPELKGNWDYDSRQGSVKILLDGQQRITSLYLLIRGEIPPYYKQKDIMKDPRGLYVNISTLELQYYKKILMLNNPFWISVTDIFQKKVKGNKTVKDIKQKGYELSEEEEDKIFDNFDAIEKILDREFLEQEIPVKAILKNAIDIFYIVNSSGVNLTDAELALAQISGYWPEAREEFKRKLEELKKGGFVFKLDFIIYCLLGVLYNYGILNCGEGSDEEGRMQYAPTGDTDRRGSTGLPRRFAPRNDKIGALCNDKISPSPYPLPSRERERKNENNNLLVIAPTSSGKTFIGEMAAIAQVIHLQKIIYLVPLRALADEKYRHFKNLYRDCGTDIVISTRDRKENDHHIISGDYDVAVMAYEKFYYFCLMSPQFLDIVSLVIIDELQLINDSKWGPLLESMVNHIDRNNKNIRIIALSAFIEEQETLLRWFPAQTLISYQRPVELRKGIVRDGVFEYITSRKEENCKKEVFFKPEAVGENCFEDYLLETVRYLVKQGESVLIFFATCAETQKWAKWLASHLESPGATCALKELKEMEETLSRDELRETLEKGIAYYNPDLSWEERNLIETYQKEGEIKVICATSIMAMGINLHFKNVIIALDKIYNDEGDYPPNYRTSLTFAAVENMGGRAGILNLEEMRKEGNSFNFQNRQEFGRVIFLAHSLLFQTVYQNLYFKFLKGNNCNHKADKQLINIDNDLLTYLLRLMVNIKFKHGELKSYLKKEEFVSRKNQSKSDGKDFLSSGYWQFAFNKENIDSKIENCLNILKGNRLIRMNENGVLSPTDSGILIAAKRIKVETFLFFKSWLSYCKNGDISILEILFLLALSLDGKALPIPFSQAIRDDYKKGIFQDGYRKNYWNKLLHLIFEQDDEEKKLFRDKILMIKEKEEITSLEDYITFMKTHLLYDWIMGKKSVKAIEQEYGLYRGCIYRLGEGFSWLADSLSAIAESAGWEKKINKDLSKIRMLSNRLVEGVQEEGLNLALLYIPGLSRHYIGRLVRAGYGDGNCLKEVSEEELIKILPKRLVGRIKNRFSAKNYKVRDGALQSGSPTEGRYKVCPYTHDGSRNLKVNTLLALPKTENCKPTFATILEIDRRHTDRIIFEGKVVKLTPLAFSLLYLLAQNPKEVLLYDYLINTIWKGSEDATYTQVTFHLSKIRRAVLKTICHNKKNRKKVKDIFKVISRRGVMLNLAEDKLKIS